MIAVDHSAGTRGNARGTAVARPIQKTVLTSGKDGTPLSERIFCVLAIVVGAAAAIYFVSSRASLWEDEIIAITHGNQALPLLFVELLRNDIHPPLYFLQLNAWIALGSNTDQWALLNSLLWAALSLATIFFVTRATHGARAAWFSTAIFAVFPSFVWSAGTLRMYAAIPACALLVYYFNRRWFATREPKILAAILLIEVLAAYLHAIEFYFVAFIALGSLLEAAAAGRLLPVGVRSTRSDRMWVGIQALFCIAILPIAASGLMRGSDASAPGSALATLSAAASLVAGWKFSTYSWARIGGGAILFFLLAVAIRDRTSRWRTLVIPVGALVVAVFISLLLKPIFKQPVFASNLLPFVAMGAGAAAAHARPARVIVLLCVAVLTIAAFPIIPLQRQAEGYVGVGRLIAREAGPGDVVVVPNVSVYWGVLRYAIGPRWGEPLRIMPPPNRQWMRLNEKISGVLGADSVRKLGLVPERNFVDHNGARYLLGENALVETRTAPHVWVVTRDRYEANVRIDPRLIPSQAERPRTFGDGELLVRRFDRPSIP